MSITSRSARAPTSSPQRANPAAAPPAETARPNSRAAVAPSPLSGVASTLRWRCSRRWPYSARRSSSRQSRVTWLSDPIETGTPAFSQCGRSLRPSPRLASVLGHSTMPAPVAATASISARLTWVACTRCQRASMVNACAGPWPRPLHSQSTGLWPVAARQSSTSPVCSAMWMCTGPASSATRLASAAIDSGRAARSEWMATPALMCACGRDAAMARTPSRSAST